MNVWVDSLQEAMQTLGGTKKSNVARTKSTAFQNVLQKKINAPESMEQIFQDASRTYGVPVNLLKAVAKAESGFDAGAVSPKGAVGVMQLMPSTARGLGVTNPYDAKSNIFGGAKYLKENLDRYDGDVSLALAAYNAGCNNVKKYGGIPPFKETQNYVKKVMGYMGEDISLDDRIVCSDAGNAAFGRVTGGFRTLGEYCEYCGADSQYGLGSLYGLQGLTMSGLLDGLSGSESGGGAFSKDTAFYMVELMRMRMDMNASSLRGDDADGLSAFL